MFWRFYPIESNNVDIFLSRDSDSRITDREMNLVKNVDNDKDALGYADIKKSISTLSKNFNSKYSVFLKPEESKDENPKFFVLFYKKL